MTTRSILKLLTLAAALLTTAVSSTATAGPVNQFLTGGVVDPMATTLRVVPPKGGMVVVHQNGRAVAWLMRAGVLNLKPNNIYSVTATRGQSMLFSTNIRMRRGFTELVWAGSNTPQMSYVPAFNAGFRQPANTSSRRAPSRSRLPSHTHQRAISQLSGLPSDGDRWHALTSYNSRYTLTTAQKRAFARTFTTTAYRAKAETTLGLQRSSAARPAAKRATSTRTTSKRATSKRATSKRATSKRATSKRATSKRATSKRATSKRATSKRTTSEPTTSKPTTTKASAAQRSTKKRRGLQRL